jgi:4-hydroxy-tetrahydrodipicolinate synthase
MSAAMERVRAALTGISGIHVTPYDGEGAIDLGLVRKLVARIAQAGVQNIVSGGTTGEFFCLTAAEVERMQAEAFAAVGDMALRTAAVGRSLREALATARAAIANGAEALMIHHPMDPFAAPVAQADYFIAIAEAVTVPVMAYLRTDLIAPDDVARIAGHANVAALKFATPNLVYLGDCMRAAPAAAIWVCGLAEGWAPAFYGAGARGFTSGFVNVDPAYSLRIWAALEAGRYAEARALVEPIAPFEKLRTKFNNGANVTVVKEAMQLDGWQVGPVRLPGQPRLTDDDRVRLAQILARFRAGRDRI